MKTPLLSTAAASGFLLSLVSVSSALDTLLVDRGLPVIHLNETAGPDRSNVVWAAASPGFLVGDDFTLAGQDHYTVTTIRVWSTDSTGLMLWGGLDKKSIAPISSTYTVTPVTYANSETYQGYEGGFSPLYRLDFAVNLSIKGGKLYDFFLDGPSATTYVHSSNAALSGSPQQGADDILLFLGPEGDIFTYHTSDGAWDKDSDANVQVFGTSNKKKAKPSK